MLCPVRVGMRLVGAMLLGRVSEVSFQAAEPDVDRGDVDGGFVAHGQLVESGGHGAVLLEQVDAALDGVALLVRFLVEGGRSAALGTALAPVGGLVVLDRDDAPDPAPT